MPSADFSRHGARCRVRPAFRASPTHGYALRSPQIRVRDLSPPKLPIYLRPVFRFGFAVSSPLTWSRRPRIGFLFVTIAGLGENVVDGVVQVDTYAHVRRLPLHGLSPRRSCLRLVLSSTSYPFGIMTPVEETGTKHRGLSPHKITPMLGVLRRGLESAIGQWLLIRSSPLMSERSGIEEDARSKQWPHELDRSLGRFGLSRVWNDYASRTRHNHRMDYWAAIQRVTRGRRSGGS